MAKVSVPDEVVTSMIECVGEETVKRFLYRYNGSSKIGIINQFCRWVDVDEFFFDDIMCYVVRSLEDGIDSSHFNDRFIVEQFCNDSIGAVMTTLLGYEELFDEADSVLRAIVMHIAGDDTLCSDYDTPFIEYCKSIVDAMRDKIG